MSIWVYNSKASFNLTDRDIIYCIYCRTKMTILLNSVRKPDICCLAGKVIENACDRNINVCSNCGWWNVSYIDYRENYGNYGVSWESSLYRKVASLKKLKLSDISTPLDEVRQYLLVKYQDRFLLNPRKLEELVGSVFQDFGYKIRVTSYSGDDGIDVFVFESKNNDLVGIQVKRYKKKIEASQIREFAGAIILNGVTKGIFITTSGFTRGSISTVEKYQKRGFKPIYLLDAQKFYEHLEIANRARYKNMFDDTAPFYSLLSEPLTEVSYDNGYFE